MRVGMMNEASKVTAIISFVQYITGAVLPVIVFIVRATLYPRLCSNTFQSEKVQIYTQHSVPAPVFSYRSPSAPSSTAQESPAHVAIAPCALRVRPRSAEGAPVSSLYLLETYPSHSVTSLQVHVE